MYSFMQKYIPFYFARCALQLNTGILSKKKHSVTYTNVSSCPFTVPFYTSKLQISSPGHNMLLKHVRGLAGVNIVHSSPPGTLFLICG